MRCRRHFDKLHCRLKKEATGLDHVGQWSCALCHKPLEKLLEYGHLEFSDKRETLPYRPIPRPTPEEILKSLEAQKGLARRVSLLGSALAPAGTPSSTGALNLTSISGEDFDPNVYSGSAGQLQENRSMPEPTPKKVFIDAANIDLDDPDALGREPKPRAKPKPKTKAKPRAKPKKAAPQSDGLF